MKTITLLPVKNESWILRSALKNISDFSDHIIIADQNSTDGSKEIYKEFKKVIVIKNNNQGHSNSVRWQLLDYARNTYGQYNLILCIDADEMISPEAIKYIKNVVLNKKDAISFSFPWIQLWGGIDEYRNDSVWKNNYKTIVFIDNGKIDYKRTTVLNDHTDRVPKCNREIKVDQFPLLHYQYIIPKQAELKQVWYRCSELISGQRPKKINYKYSFISDNKKIILKSTMENWFKDLPPVSTDYKIKIDWRYKEIKNWFDKYGIQFFEPLDIWHINELKEEFIRKTNREPRPEKFPDWLIKLNTIKNKIKNYL